MKILNKKYLTLGSLLFLSLILLPTSIINTNGILEERNPAVYEMSFIHAEYMDADLDGYEDDTRFSVFVDFNTEFFDTTSLRIDCLFEIILPSETTYTFKGYIRLEPIDCVIRFDVYNTVTESGWYTINFYSSVKLYNVKYTCFCTIIFDPPTGTGEGGGTSSIDLGF
ncbi:MAG: hypothetical protein FK734_08865 [Asgard group archaeon]|nr:hypothetical protein [Asgard group archaeon]